MSTKSTVDFYLNLPPSDYALIKKCAEKHHVTLKIVVRLALKNFFDIALNNQEHSNEMLKKLSRETVGFNVRLPSSEVELIRAYAEERHIAKSLVVRLALKAFFDKGVDNKGYSEAVLKTLFGENVWIKERKGRNR